MAKKESMKKEEVIHNLIFGGRVSEEWEQDLDRYGWINCNDGEFIDYKEINEERLDYTCQVCGDVGYDRRTLGLRYFYALEEVSPKLKRIELKFADGGKDYLYTLRTCKGCRAVFMFNYLADFIENGGKLRKEMKIDDDGIREILLNEWERMGETLQNG